MPVITGEPDPPQSTKPVDFSIDRLKQTGFTLAGNMSEEVRGTFVTNHQSLVSPFVMEGYDRRERNRVNFERADSWRK